MSADGEGDGSGGGAGRREVAHRVFAAEFDDATVSYRESDEERAPNYVVTPTGARANRLFAVGVLTEVEAVNDDVVRARVADPTGAFVSYAGQYQPDPLAFFERTDPPAFVALTGKARTFEPDDGDRIYASVRPESVNAVDADTRDRWVVSAAEATLERIALFEEALAAEERGDDLRERLGAAGCRESLAAGIPVAIERYGTTPAYLEAVRQTAVQALELVAGDRDAVEGIDLAPDEGGPASVGPTPDPERSLSATERAAVEDASGEETEPATDAAGETTTAAEETATDAETTTESEPTDTGTTDAAAESTVAAEADSSTEAEPPGESASAGDDIGDFDGGSLGGAETDESGEAAGGGAAATAETDDSETTGAVEDEEEMYELDEAERREVEEEFGTEFATGSEVDAPGEAGIETPDPEDADAPAAGDAESDAGLGDETAAPAGSEASAEAPDGAETSADDGAPATGGADDVSGTETAAAGKSAGGEGTADDSGADEDTADEDETAAGEEPDANLEDAVIDAMEALDGGDGADRESVLAAVVDDHGADPGAVEDAIQDALMSGRCYEPSDGTLKSI
jgi:RPA family protein